MLQTELLVEEQVGKSDEGLRLAAALAAVLLEYRQQRREAAADSPAPAGGPRWRMMARFEQLQGPQ
jgi:hypothetical protein